MHNCNIHHHFQYIAFLIFGSIVSCIPTDEYTLPEPNTETKLISGNPVTIKAVQQMIAQQQAKAGRNAKVVFEEHIGMLTGYVVSNDQSGNFYKEIILQDHPSQPTAGIRVLVDQNPLYTQYNRGRKIVIPLEGLAAGIENGVPTLGMLEESSIAAIGRTQVSEILQRSTEIEEIIPLELPFNEITNAYLNLFVRLDHVQFSDTETLGEYPYTYAAQPRDWFDGERLLIHCTTGDTLIVSTSTFSDFKAVSLPKGQGSIKGILTKDYRGKEFNLVLNSPTDVKFDTEQRCTP